MVEYTAFIRESREEVRKRNARRSEEALEDTLEGFPYPSCTPLAAGDKYGGMADGAAVKSKRDRTGCAGMARCLIPAIWPRSSRSNHIL